MLSFTEENYLKAIWKLGKGQEVVSTNAIAAELSTRAASVTDMLKKLADKGFIDYAKYQGVQLIADGRMIAMRVLRKHRLWEVFLYEKLHFTWDEIHEIAEQLEHIQSDKLVERLDIFLGRPARDPHGDPIPDAEGTIVSLVRLLLNEAETGKMLSICGVKDENKLLLQFLNQQDLQMGVKLKVISVEAFDQSLQVEVEGSRDLRLSKNVAESLYVQYV